MDLGAPIGERVTENEPIERPEPLARLPVKGPRRIAALGALCLLGLIVIRLAFHPDMSIGAQVILLGIAFVVLFGAYRLYLGTELDLILTKSGLEDLNGRVIAPLDNIKDIETGLFAVKPPSGFAIRLKTPMKAAWVPGVWWRLGRKVGVGGAVSAPDAKMMAEMLAVLIAKRDGLFPDDLGPL